MPAFASWTIASPACSDAAVVADMWHAHVHTFAEDRRTWLSVCDLLAAECASSALPFKVVEVLASRGKPHVALQVLRACSRAARDNAASALHETQAAVRILLECNLVTEAYFEVDSTG